MNSSLTRLSSALAERQEHGAPLNIFFRDDDVDADEESLRRLLRFFGDRETPVNLAIIPGLLTDGAVKLLTDSRSSHSGLFGLNQHGWRHVNHEREGRKCEFGASRGFAEQFDDIARGRARLDDAFGADWFPAFVPPWNRCTEATHQALDRLGYQVFSAKQGGAPVTGFGFREISITLDLFNWRGGASLKPAEDIVDDLIAQMSGQQTIGVMLHHKVMGEEVFSFLGPVLDALKQNSIVRFHTFQSLLRE
ncbi:MAG: polysaccharide deacetylase family protein [Blastocatellia bacterium]